MSEPVWSPGVVGGCGVEGSEDVLSLLADQLRALGIDADHRLHTAGRT
jgi:hypothetical protein